MAIQAMLNLKMTEKDLAEKEYSDFIEEEVPEVFSRYRYEEYTKKHESNMKRYNREK